MNFSKLNIETLFIIAFVICVVYSSFLLFSFKNELMYTYGVLETAEADRSSGAFVSLYATIGFTFFLGLVTLMFLKKFGQAELVYVEKRKNEDTVNEIEVKSDVQQLDIGFYKNIKPSLSLDERLELGLNRICNDLKAGQGALYVKEQKGRKEVYAFKKGFAINALEDNKKEFVAGDGIIGQVVKEAKSMIITDVPENYVRIESGLGNSSPTVLLACPALVENKVLGVIELALFSKLNQAENDFLNNCLAIFAQWLDEQKIDEEVEQGQKEKKNEDKEMKDMKEKKAKNINKSADK